MHAREKGFWKATCVPTHCLEEAAARSDGLPFSWEWWPGGVVWRGSWEHVRRAVAVWESDGVEVTYALVMAMALFAASYLTDSDAIDSCWLNEGSCG
jgi:hypothetical protein